MKLDDLFPSKYLKASDAEQPLTLTIKGVEIEEMKSREEKDERKPVLYFKENEKGMVLNKTNAKVIESFYGDDIDEWVGKRVTIVALDVDAFGEVKKALRVSTKKPAADKAALIAAFSKLYEKAKTLKVDGLQDYVIAPNMTEDEITALGKELKVKVEAAQAF